MESPILDSSLVTVLIRREVRGAHQTLEERFFSDDIGPDAFLTSFGWCVTCLVQVHFRDKEQSFIFPIQKNECSTGKINIFEKLQHETS
jgi:hypothetical protein